MVCKFKNKKQNGQMKRIVNYFVIVLALFLPAKVMAYDFSAVAPSGQTLYYNFLNDYSGVEVTCHHFIGTIMYNDGDTAYYNLVGEITIPDSVEYGGIMYCVKGISDGAFVNCAGITGVTFPEHLEYIGTSAFLSCSNLSGWINIHEGVTVGAYAFQACFSITNLIIRNNVTIGEQAFHVCQGIREVYMEPNIISIGNGAFFFGNHDTIARGIHFNGTMDEWVEFEHHRRLHGPWNNDGYGGIARIVLYVNTNESDYWPFHQHKVTRVELSEEISDINSYAFYNVANIDTLILNDSLPPMGTSIFGGSEIATIVSLSLTPPSSNIINGIRHIRSLLVPVGYYNHQQIGTDTLYTNVIVPFGSINDYMSVWGTSFLRYYTDNIADIELTALVNDSNRGEVHIISSEYDQSANGIEVVISAEANYGYHFDHWSYGGTANPDTIHLTSDSTVVAYFERNQYSVLLHANDSSTGNVFGGGEYYYLDTAIITAVAAEHYHFLHWVISDNNLDESIMDERDTLRVVVRGDTSFTAYFEVNYYSVGADVDSLFHGRVEVYDNNHVAQNTYAYGTGISMTAIPYSGYQFSHWSNGITENPYTFALVGNVQLTAYFTYGGSISHQRDTVFVHDTTMVIDTVILTEYITEHDTVYEPVHDTTMVNDTITLTEYITNYDTVYVPIHDTTVVNLTDTITLIDYDTITNTLFDTVVIYITDTLWLHDTVFVHDTIVVGVDEAETVNVKIYISNGHIVVEGADGNTVWLYDINGRLLATKQDDCFPLQFEVPTSGIYLVKVGNYKVRKIVMIR